LSFRDVPETVESEHTELVNSGVDSKPIFEEEQKKKAVSRRKSSRKDDESLNTSQEKLNPVESNDKVEEKPKKEKLRKSGVSKEDLKTVSKENLRSVSNDNLQAEQEEVKTQKLKKERSFGGQSNEDLKALKRGLTGSESFSVSDSFDGSGDESTEKQPEPIQEPKQAPSGAENSPQELPQNPGINRFANMLNEKHSEKKRRSKERVPCFGNMYKQELPAIAGGKVGDPMKYWFVVNENRLVWFDSKPDLDQPSVGHIDLDHTIAGLAKKKGALQIVKSAGLTILWDPAESKKTAVKWIRDINSMRRFDNPAAFFKGKSGLLFKLGRFNKWKPHFFYTTSGILYYFNSLGIRQGFFLSGGKIEEYPRGKNAFQLETKSAPPLVLRAENQSEMFTWIAAITESKKLEEGEEQKPRKMTVLKELDDDDFEKKLRQQL